MMLMEAALFGFVVGIVFAGVAVGVFALFALWDGRKRSIPFADSITQWRKKDEQ
jgi:hypothetical protein